MSLSDYKIETRVFKLKGGPITVMGLSLIEITTLVRHHLPDLESLFEMGSQVLSGKAELTSDDLTKLAIAFAEHAPGFVANVIALASGDHTDSGVKIAGKLPFPIQIDILTAIMQLTFEEAGGIKKAFERVMALLKSSNVQQLVKQVPLP